MSRSFLFAKEIGPDARSKRTASDHVAVLAALDYSREDRHDRSTMTMFATLITSYWDDLSLGERRTIAKALAGRPDLPKSLINQFLADHFTVANLVIDASPLLDEPDFYRIADSHVMPMIRVVARRTIPTDLVTTLANMRDTSTALALALNTGIYPDTGSLNALLDVAAKSKHVARALALREDLPLNAMMTLYPELGQRERMRVIDLAERDSLINLNSAQQRAPLTALTDDQRMTLVDLSKRLSRSEFVDRLNGLLMLDRRYLDAILENDAGEIQAIIFAGLGFSASQATTLFIILGAEEARSYKDIKSLVDLFERVKWRIADRFLNTWREHRPLQRTVAARAESLGERDDSRKTGIQTGDQAGRRSRNPLDHGIIRKTGTMGSSNKG